MVFPTEISANECEDIKRKYGICGDFAISVLGDGINKNVISLIAAYGEMILTQKANFKLVIVCKVRSAIYMQWMKLIENYKLNSDVIITGYVSERELEIFYTMAKWMIFPSLYEGFGLPVIEAWKHNIPVLTSVNSSLGEIAYDSAVLVDPFSVKSISEGLTKINTMTEEERNDYIIKGRNRSRDFDWEKTALNVRTQLEQVKNKKRPKLKLPEVIWSSKKYIYFNCLKNHWQYLKRGEKVIKENND